MLNNTPFPGGSAKARIRTRSKKTGSTTVDIGIAIINIWRMLIYSECNQLFYYIHVTLSYKDWPAAYTVHRMLVTNLLTEFKKGGRSLFGAKVLLLFAIFRIQTLKYSSKSGFSITPMIIPVISIARNNFKYIADLSKSVRPIVPVKTSRTYSI